MIPVRVAQEKNTRNAADSIKRRHCGAHRRVTLQKATILPDCGHWTQQEKAAEVNSLLIEFLRELKLS
jgi:pimeloyl-ACP methyl ester carboxylesterase